MGYIETICISHKKGIVKKEIPNAVLKENWGIRGGQAAFDTELGFKTST